MERSLCLLIGKDPNFDGSNYLVLTVPTNDHVALDAFIMNRFADGDDVREYFKPYIVKFLKEISDPTQKFDINKGSINIIERLYNQAPVKRRVMYSKIRQQVQEILDCRAFMQSYVDAKPELFSEFLRDVICVREGHNYSKTEIKKMLRAWKDEILKAKPKGTDHLRAMLKAYEEWVEETNNNEPDETRKIKMYRYEVPKAQIKRLQKNRLKTEIKEN